MGTAVFDSGLANGLMPRPFIVERVESAKDLAAIYRLRVAAWRSRTDYFPDIAEWQDSHDATACHWAIRDGERIVAAARLTIHDRLADAPSAEIYEGVLPADLAGPIAVMTRLVVARSHGGQGLSRLLDVARIDHARASGCRHILGETFAGLPRLNAVVELGFTIVGLSGAYASGPLRQVKEERGGGKSSACSHFDLPPAPPLTATIFSLGL